MDLLISHIVKRINENGSFGPHFKAASGYENFSDTPLEISPKVTKREYQKYEKNIDAKYILMSPDEYINKVVAGFKTNSPNVTHNQILNARDQAIVDKYVSDFKRGDIFPSLVLDYKHGFNQEGLHRAMAAKLAGIDKVSVLIVTPAKYTPQEKINYLLRRESAYCLSQAKELAEENNIQLPQL